jgi:hypothetical protein
MDLNKCMGLAEKMAANAKSGTLKVGEHRYMLTFNHATWLFDVTRDGEPFRDFTGLNTKSLKQARQWLREYLEN